MESFFDEIAYVATKPSVRFAEINPAVEEQLQKLFGIPYAVDRADHGHGPFPGAAVAAFSATLAVVTAGNSSRSFHLIPAWRRPWDCEPCQNFIRTQVDCVWSHCRVSAGGPIQLKQRRLLFFQHPHFYDNPPHRRRPPETRVLWAQQFFGALIADYVLERLTIEEKAQWAFHGCVDNEEFRRHIEGFLYQQPDLVPAGDYCTDSARRLHELAAELFTIESLTKIADRA